MKFVTKMKTKEAIYYFWKDQDYETEGIEKKMASCQKCRNWGNISPSGVRLFLKTLMS